MVRWFTRRRAQLISAPQYSRDFYRMSHTPRISRRMEAAQKVRKRGRQQAVPSPKSVSGVGNNNVDSFQGNGSDFSNPMVLGRGRSSSRGESAPRAQLPGERPRLRRRDRTPLTSRANMTPSRAPRRRMSGIRKEKKGPRLPILTETRPMGIPLDSPPAQVVEMTIGTSLDSPGVDNGHAASSDSPNARVRPVSKSKK